MINVFNKLLKRKKLLVGLLILATVVIGGYFWWQTSRQNGLEKAVVERGEIRAELVLSGEIDADEKVTLKFQTAGMLNWVGVKEGDLVKAGQVIASIDTRSARKSLEKELNDYLTKRWDLDQTRENYRNSPLSDMIKRLIDQDQFDMNNAVLDVEIQDLAIQLSSLSTPIAGVVTSLDFAYPGVNVLPTQNIAEIINPLTVHFIVSADQTEVIKIHEGDQVSITLDSWPEETFIGKVRRIALVPKKDEVGTVYDVFVDFENLDFSQFNYRIGMTGDATFVLDRSEDVLYVPSNFVKTDDQGKFVLINKGKDKVYVEVGIEGEEVVEIRGDIEAGDLVYD